MKTKVERTKEKDFEPIDITFTIETEEEQYAIDTMFGYFCYQVNDNPSWTDADRRLASHLRYLRAQWEEGKIPSSLPIKINYGGE